MENQAYRKRPPSQRPRANRRAEREGGMKKGIELTYQLCMAIGQDEGDRNMRKNGRKAWNEEDYNVAAKKANELLDKISV
jgi:hypothetical protein